MLNLIIHSLKGKKNWFLLNLIITVIISIILPTLFRDNYGFFSAFTMFITAGLIMVSNFREFLFLHDDSKIAYYMSKPINMTSKINVALISNLIFTTFVFLLTFVISSVSGALFTSLDPVNNVETFKYLAFVENNFMFINIMYAWLVMLSFVIALSSILTGNDVVSIFVTIFNFALPVIVLLVVTFICNILDNSIVGMSTDALIQVVIDKYILIEKIYFFDYGYQKNIDIIYFSRLIAYFIVTYILMLFAIKTRKNEKTGDFIVHNGYKYFISIFASLLLPMFITSNMRNYNITTIVIVIVLLSALSYYILLSILDRSFRISKQAIQIYLPFVIIFAGSIFISFGVLRVRAAYIPEISNVKAVYIGSNNSYKKNVEYLKKIDRNYEWDSLISAKYDEIKDNDSLLILNEEESIEKLIKLQQALINKNDNRSYRGFHIIYYLNDGQKIVRSYSIPYDEVSTYYGNEVIDIARTEEFIEKKFEVLNDDYYIDNVKFNNVVVTSGDKQVDVVDFNYREFARLYMEDYREFISKDENIKKISSNILLEKSSYDFSFNYIDESKIDKDDYVYNEKYAYDTNNTVYFDYEIIDGVSIEYIAVPDEFTRTMKFIENLIDEN